MLNLHLKKYALEPYFLALSSSLSQLPLRLHSWCLYLSSPTFKSIGSSNFGLRTLMSTSFATVISRVSVKYLPSIPLFLFLFGFFVASVTSRTRYLPYCGNIGLSI
ncbi:hypothetical protein AAZX31_03G092600 [Glycine max]